MRDEVAMSRVGRDQCIDALIVVEATGEMDAELRAERQWREAGNTGRFFVVDVRTK